MGDQGRAQISANDSLDIDFEGGPGPAEEQFGFEVLAPSFQGLSLYFLAAENKQLPRRVVAAVEARQVIRETGSRPVWPGTKRPTAFNGLVAAFHEILASR